MSKKKVPILPAQTQEVRRSQRQRLGLLSDQVLLSKTKSRYQEIFERFKKFHAWVDSFKIVAWEEFDEDAAQFIEYLWESGAPKSDASYALAAIQFYRPQAKHHLPWSWKLVKTWNQLELPTRATPLTPEWVMALAGKAFEWRQHRMGWLLVVGFSLFLRTGELVDLKANQVSLAARHSSQSVVYLNQTKTTKRNNLPLERIIVDEELAHRALEELLVGLAPGETLSQLSHYQFRRLWHDLIHSLKLTGCGFAPYSLRRGGATSAYRAGVPLDALVTKGRWAHLATCRLYLDQGAQALTEFKLPAASRPALAAASRKFLSVSQQGTRGMRATCKRKTQ